MPVRIRYFYLSSKYQSFCKTSSCSKFCTTVLISELWGRSDLVWPRATPWALRAAADFTGDAQLCSKCEAVPIIHNVHLNDCSYPGIKYMDFTTGSHLEMPLALEFNNNTSSLSCKSNQNWWAVQRCSFRQLFLLHYLIAIFLLH